MLQKGVDAKEAEKRILAADIAFPFARVQNYSKLISRLTLPDEDDRHILAAAIKAKATVIVTNNTKDFPKKYIGTFHIDVQTPDIFLHSLVSESSVECILAFKEMVLNKRHPPCSEKNMLEILLKAGLVKTVKSIQKLL